MEEELQKTNLIGSPSAYFKTVQDLVDSKDLNTKEKLSALYNWKSLCELQKASTAEGMHGERTTPISEVMKAIRELESAEKN